MSDRNRGDFILIFTVAVLVIAGIVMVFSASYYTALNTQGDPYYYLKRDIIWALLGAVLMFVASKVSYKTYDRWTFPILIAGVVLLLLVFTPFGVSINGARRWIQLAGFTLQPSELGKVIITLFMAKFLAARTRALESEPFWKVMVPSGIWVGPTILLVLAGEDLGTTVLLGSLYLLMLFVAGMRLRYILPFTLILPPVAVLVIKQFDAMRWGRLTVFMDAEAYKMTSGYQLWNSLLALGSGGWTGVGFTESRLKLMYLPENHTDFILSIVGEELGFITLLTVIVAYLIMVFVGLRISVKARTRQGMLIAFGMSIFIGMQALINIGVITAAFPTKGMPAPMISYGGSNLLACLVAAACVAGVAIDSAVPDYQDKLLASSAAAAQAATSTPA